METYLLLGAILIVIAILAFAYQGMSFPTKEKVINFGSLQMIDERASMLPLPPIVGAIALVGGVVLLVIGSIID